VKTFLIIVGGAICAAGLYLLYLGIRLTEANLDTGTFSLRVWEALFWLKHPPQLEHGLGDNGRALLELLGGIVLALVGWRILSAGDRLAE
jgi:threonine/homoserine/homoserine lactone efflux protein